MVTKIIAIDKDTVTTEFKITKDCIFVKNNLLTESGIIENAAQACSSIFGQSFFDEDDLEGEGNTIIGFISGIKKVSIYKLPRVNDTMTTKAQLISRFDSDSFSLCTIACKTYAEEDIIVDATINFLIQEV
jgi:acyl dehydratase